MRKRLEYESENKMYGRIDDACRRYSLGRNSMRRVASEAEAVVHVGRSCLISFARVDAYMESRLE